jgi:hypothetical protein
MTTEVGVVPTCNYWHCCICPWCCEKEGAVVDWIVGTRRIMKPIIAIRIHVGAKGNRCARWFENIAIVMAKRNAAAHGGVDKRFA